MVTMTMVVVTEFIIESRVELVEKSPLKLLEQTTGKLLFESLFESLMN